MQWCVLRVKVSQGGVSSAMDALSSSLTAALCERRHANNALVSKFMHQRALFTCIGGNAAQLVLATYFGESEYVHWGQGWYLKRKLFTVGVSRQASCLCPLNIICGPNSRG
jgi:hypothetical protein